eukprot:434473_1
MQHFPGIINYFLCVSITFSIHFSTFYHFLSLTYLFIFLDHISHMLLQLLPVFVALLCSFVLLLVHCMYTQMSRVFALHTMDIAIRTDVTFPWNTESTQCVPADEVSCG